jgi:hypothetical protein
MAKLDQKFIDQQVRSTVQQYEGRGVGAHVIPLQHMGDVYDAEIAARVKEAMRRNGRPVTVAVVGAGWLHIEAEH